MIRFRFHLCSESVFTASAAMHAGPSPAAKEEAVANTKIVTEKWELECDTETAAARALPGRAACLIRHA